MNRRAAIVVFIGISALSIGVLTLLGVWLTQTRRGPVEPRLRVTALDVGQGDAILIQTPRGDDILVDGGPDDSVVQGLERHLALNNREIELVVLTHPDQDHVGGLPAVARAYKIDRVLQTGVRSTSRADRAWVQAIIDEGSVVETARAGQTFNFGEVTLRVLWPQTDADLETKERNDTSVVFTLTYGTTDWLFTGDMSSKVEERLVQSQTLTDIDVLKVPHHGSISSSSEAFLDETKPEYAVFSLRKNNPYGHPHPVVLRRYEHRGVAIFRTDELGDIQLWSSGQGINITP